MLFLFFAYLFRIRFTFRVHSHSYDFFTFNVRESVQLPSTLGVEVGFLISLHDTTPAGPAGPVGPVPHLSEEHADPYVKIDGRCTLAPPKSFQALWGPMGGPLATHGCPSDKVCFG